MSPPSPPSLHYAAPGPNCPSLTPSSLVLVLPWPSVIVVGHCCWLWLMLMPLPLPLPRHRDTAANLNHRNATTSSVGPQPLLLSTPTPLDSILTSGSSRRELSPSLSELGGSRPPPPHPRSATKTTHFRLLPKHTTPLPDADSISSPSRLAWTRSSLRPRLGAPSVTQKPPDALVPCLPCSAHHSAAQHSRAHSTSTGTSHPPRSCRWSSTTLDARQRYRTVPNRRRPSIPPRLPQILLIHCRSLSINIFRGSGVSVSVHRRPRGTGPSSLN